ncbi:MAG: hypothetical protein FWE50_00490 [Alphaproteobacteria bacterium]|nr:hypothetical protein [Alphaproteobacteria bacterium]
MNKNSQFIQPGLYEELDKKNLKFLQANLLDAFDGQEIAEIQKEIDKLTVEKNDFEQEHKWLDVSDLEDRAREPLCRRDISFVSEKIAARQAAQAVIKQRDNRFYFLTVRKIDTK